MADLLVKLYALPPLAPAVDSLAARGIALRRALVPEKPRVVDFVRVEFPPWVAEVEVAFARTPVACFIAATGNQVLGFACHDIVCRNFFGPTGVSRSAQRQGIGRALLLATLHAQREAGYAYAIIAGVGPEAFYAKAVGAVPIAGSTPGAYAGMLR